MSPEEKEIRQRLKDDFCHYASKCLKIRTKSGSIVPLSLNKAQLYIHQRLEEQRGRTGSIRALILKGRQQGCSTLVGARFYHKVSQSFGTLAFILAHDLGATNALYEMANRYYENTPDPVKPMVSKSNAKELVFGRLQSGYKLGTSENKNAGRSMTIQLLHGSEVAHWKNTIEHTQGVMQAVPNGFGTEIILESTAAGVGNYFHQMWQDAEAGISEYIPIFVPWYWQDEYTKETKDEFVRTQHEEELVEFYGLSNEQLNWRRFKIIDLSKNGVDGTKAFNQEYPNCATEAFILTGEDNYIPSDVVVMARKTRGVERVGPMILGVDPARFGDDRTCIIRRCGRAAYKLESHSKLDTMQVTGLIKTIIDSEQPAKVCIDIGGLGAGIYDRLKELGYGQLIVAVNFGGTPYNASKYRNKKAEMWALLYEWLSEMPCEIPDLDELHSDLTSVKYEVDSNSRLVIESKDHMKKRGIRSPDAAEALALTFAIPNSALHANINKQQSEVLKSLTDGMSRRRETLERARFKR